MAMDPTLALSSPPPAQLPPAFPLQTAESRDRLTASWVTMNSVGQCKKVLGSVLDSVGSPRMPRVLFLLLQHM